MAELVGVIPGNCYAFYIFCFKVVSALYAILWLSKKFNILLYHYFFLLDIS